MLKIGSWSRTSTNWAQYLKMGIQRRKVGRMVVGTGQASNPA